MALRPICEPVELPLDATVLAERVRVAPEAPAFGRFTHFHDVAELVLFRKVRGEFIAGGRHHRLRDGAITFVPSMHHHDFALEPGAMEWVLIQIDPYLVEALAAQRQLRRLARPFCALPTPAMRSRLQLLSEWLVDESRDPRSPAIERIVELLLLGAVEAPLLDSAPGEESTSEVARLLPALEQLRSDPADPITLERAASLCRLSPAYFSRRFKQRLGMNFTDYARVYRLHLAARRLATTESPISEIAYQLGFSSPSHFGVRFRERFGMSPREYRTSARLRAAS
jgi:AraC-like DNA-binding protein